MRTKFLIILSVAAQCCWAQTKIGDRNTGIEPSAAVELSANNKALISPRVALTATDDLLTVPNPSKGMLVYSTVTGDKSLGNKRIFAEQQYFFNGTEWQLMIDKTALGNLAIPGVIALAKQSDPYSMFNKTQYEIQFDKKDQVITTNGQIMAPKKGYYMYNASIVWKTSKPATSTPIFNTPASRISFLFQTVGGALTSHTISYSGIVYLNIGDTSKGFSIAYGGSVTGNADDKISAAEVVWFYLGDIAN